MHIKATIVAYAFSVQCFENATIVASAGLSVKKAVGNAFATTSILILNEKGNVVQASIVV